MLFYRFYVGGELQYPSTRRYSSIAILEYPYVLEYHEVRWRFVGGDATKNNYKEGGGDARGDAANDARSGAR